ETKRCHSERIEGRGPRMSARGRAYASVLGCVGRCGCVIVVGVVAITAIDPLSRDAFVVIVRIDAVLHDTGLVDAVTRVVPRVYAVAAVVLGVDAIPHDTAVVAGEGASRCNQQRCEYKCNYSAKPSSHRTLLESRLAEARRVRRK